VPRADTYAHAPAHEKGPVSLTREGSLFAGGSVGTYQLLPVDYWVHKPNRYGNDLTTRAGGDRYMVPEWADDFTEPVPRVAWLHHQWDPSTNHPAGASVAATYLGYTGFGTP